MQATLVPTVEELTTASEEVARPDLGSGSITTVEMTGVDKRAAAEREKSKVFGFSA